MSARLAHQPLATKLVAVAAGLVILWILGQTVGEVLIVFAVSTIVALLLNPLVRRLRRLRIPRGVAVLAVFGGFVALAALAVFLVISPVRTQVEEIQANLPAYTDQAERQADGLQDFFDDRGIDVDVRERADAFLTAVEERATQAADNVVGYSLDVLGALITLIFILVACIYMLLDAPRILRFSATIGGPDAPVLLRRIERTLTEYVKAQLLVALIMAVSAGVVLWVYGVTGIFPLGATFAVAFAAWVFVMEFVPYVGPILGAVPPTLLALFTSPMAAIWVIAAFIAIQQLEGHLVVPKVMGSAVGVHPLVVIFGLLIGEQLAGVVGVLIAIPLVVVAKEAVMFVAERVEWSAPVPAPAPAAGPAGEPARTREMPTRALEAPGLRPEP